MHNPAQVNVPITPQLNRAVAQDVTATKAEDEDRVEDVEEAETKTKPTDEVYPIRMEMTSHESYA